MWSQNKEEEYILEFFKGKRPGNLLDIGAYNPEVFSNSKALIDLGWNAVLVEPSPECFKQLTDYYDGNPNVKCENYAISNFTGNLVFWNSAGACATAREEHYNLWKDAQQDFNKIEVPCKSWKDFYKHIGIRTFEFITIDAEGMDALILEQMDLFELGTRLLVIEYNYDTNRITNYLQKFGFTNVIYSNGENLMVSERI